MKARELGAFTFDDEVTDCSVIECPECTSAFSLCDWSESSLGGQDCGEHSAIRCPGCDKDFDVASTTFHVVV